MVQIQHFLVAAFCAFWDFCAFQRLRAFNGNKKGHLFINAEFFWVRNNLGVWCVIRQVLRSSIAWRRTLCYPANIYLWIFKHICLWISNIFVCGFQTYLFVDLKIYFCGFVKWIDGRFSQMSDSLAGRLAFENANIFTEHRRPFKNAYKMSNARGKRHPCDRLK